MSRHVTYRGASIDMDSIRRENEKVPAIGNMPVNARGDQIKGGVITKTADQIARENHRVQSAVINTSLKGPQPDAKGINLNSPKPPVQQPVQPAASATGPARAPKKVPKEKELPNGDIVEDTGDGE